MAETRTPALRIVQNRLKEVVEEIDGYQVFVDRSDAESLTEEEQPAINLRVVSVSLDAAPEGLWMTWHRAIIQFDCMSSGSVEETIDLANQRAIALIIEALHADRSLGGRLQDIIEQDVSGSEMDGADVGTAILQVEAWFFTPRGDHFTIVGVGGQHFTD
jgi:hypothetical protein